MFRSLFVSLSKAAWAEEAIARTPVARHLARRFVAGETIDDAIKAIRALNAGGIDATLDFLGESVTDRGQAEAAAAEYRRVLDAIDASGVRANVSLKLTQFGLDIDRAFCRDTVATVIARAKTHGNFVRIDMEGTPHTDLTLEVLDDLRRDYDNVGIVLQSYLFRTQADLEATAGRGIPVRLCKGAYQEPAHLAYPDKHEVDLNYIRLARRLMDLAVQAAPAQADGRTPALAALATHDVAMLHAVTRHAERRSIPRDRFELQMLYGIRRDLQDRYVAEGYAVRAYVPYGVHWYPYFMRRLAERPANVGFLVSNALR